MRSDRRRRVLLLCDDAPGRAENMLEHIRALSQLSRHDVKVFNPVDRREVGVRLLDLAQFDVVVIHYSVYVGGGMYLPPLLRVRIQRFRGLTVMFIQDEYRRVELVTAAIRDLGVDVLYSVVPERTIEGIYSSRLPGVQVVPTLAGFVPTGLAERTLPPLAARPIDIGYRGRRVPFWLGRLGQEKTLIGQGVLERASEHGLVVDIGWEESDRIYGEAWYRFVASCKATLGTESGASIVDYDGSLEKRVDEYVAGRPEADFDEVHDEILSEFEGNTVINVVSPRIFEAAALRTALVLFPGEHSGVVRPNEHYIPLERDFSNLDEVAAALHDVALLERLVDRTYDDVVASGAYSLERFVQQFDALLDDRAEPIARRLGLDVRVARGEARVRGRLAVVRPALRGAARRVLVRSARSAEIREAAPGRTTPVDDYWGEHTVNSRPFTSARASRDYLRWRFGEYPLYQELMGLWGDHEGKTLLDYGCGPGDDTVGFLLYSNAAHVVGMDVSARALELARGRIALHRVDPARVSLVHVGDAERVIPLDQGSIDVVHCSGVLHHTSDPAGILREFERVLKPGGSLQVMVYNRESVWFHLFTAYVRMIHEGAFPELSVEEAFARNTDGPECPISRVYSSREFLRLAGDAGFDGVFRGGYLSRTELSAIAEHRAAALEEPRLAPEHRDFLAELVFDERGFPTYRGKHAGIGGTYRLKKA